MDGLSWAEGSLQTAESFLVEHFELPDYDDISLILYSNSLQEQDGTEEGIDCDCGGFVWRTVLFSMLN